ncbi:DUF5713 family protein [Streptomyces wedmorensis]
MLVGQIRRITTPRTTHERLNDRLDTEARQISNTVSDLRSLYALTQAATEEFNLLDREFVAVGSGIETVAREWICDEFCFVASAYGFTDADAEELTAGRDW